MAEHPSEVHAELAEALLDPEPTDLDLPFANQANLRALRGIGHALLAIHAELADRKANGSGW